MPTVAEVKAANARRVLEQHATPGLEMSTDDGATWLALAAVLIATRTDEAIYDSDLEAEATPMDAILKVVDTTAELAEGTRVRESLASPVRTWEILGQPSLHPGKRQYRLGRVLLSPDGAGPNRKSTR